MKIKCEDCYFGEFGYEGGACHKPPFQSIHKGWWCLEGLPKDCNDTFIQLMEKCNTEEKLRGYIREIIREEIEKNGKKEEG